MYSRMPRVYTYFDQAGRGRNNLDKLLIPFRHMTHVGDWCEMEAGPACLAGNVAAVCSSYSKQLGRRFKFSDIKNGKFRVTVTSAPVSGRVTSAVTGSRRVMGSVAV